MSRYLVALVIIALVVGLDSITKFLIVQNLVLYRSNIPIIPNFLDIVYYKNTGAAFGILAGFSFSQYFFLAISSVALVILVVAFSYASKEGKLVQIALPLLIGGTLGNLIDRIRLGAVIDFILVHWYDKFYWPAFNVADSAITVGVALLILEMLRKK
jgi:signal peptidase II